MKVDETLAAVVAERTPELERELAERKRALRPSWDFLDGLINRIADAMVVKDDQHRFVLVNDAECSLVGQSREALLGKTDYDFFPKEQVDVFWKMDDRVLETGEASLNEETVKHGSTGKLLTVMTHKTRYVDPSGNRFVVAVIRDISERKRGEEALQASEARYRRITESLVDYQYSVRFENGHAVETTHSPACSKVTGYLAAEFRSDPYLWLRMVAPEDRELVRERVQQILAGKEIAPIEHRLLRKDGATRWVCDTTILFKDASENLLSYDGVIKDITERKRAEEALSFSEARYRRLFESAKDGVLILDAEMGMIVDVNPFLTELLGFPHEAFLGKQLWELGFFKDIVANQAHFAELQEKEYIRYEDLPMKTSDGRRIQVEFVSNVYLVDNQKVIQCNVRDITERKRAEEKIRKLSTVVEQSPVSIVITDATGAIEYVNPKFTRLTGYTLEEVRGQNPRILKGDKTSDDEYRRLWESITQGREWRGEFCNVKKSGEMYWESASISPILDTNGRITHFLAVKEDITERKALEAQFHEAQKMESVGQLAGGIAHDFNNILAATMMNLSLLGENPNLDAETRETVKELMVEAQRATTLTRQLLMFSRRSVLEVKVLDLNELVANLLKMLGRLIGEHICLLFERHDDLPSVEADPGMIEQVLMNLTVNARDAMPNGGKLTISIEPIQVDAERAKGCHEALPGQFVCLTVADTGCGMDEATRKRIFDPFYTTKEPGKGTGLGLSTVHGIVAQHKGWVEVESELGKGTTFKVFLPATTKGTTEPAQTAKMAAIPGDATILLVEDDASFRTAVSQNLRRLGYRVLEAATGQSAMKLWQEQDGQIDLLLSDMVMPEGMTGLDLAEKLQKDKPNLKVIISSGYNAELAGQAKPTAGGIVYLQKPYHIEVLSKIIRDCLARV